MTPTGKLVYAILGSIAEFERELIRERTVAGMRCRAPARRALWATSSLALHRRWKIPPMALTTTDASIAHVARQLRVGRATLYREHLGGREIIGPGNA